MRPVPTAIRVVLTKPSGESAQLDTGLESTVLCLKHHVAALWQAPVGGQRLLIGTSAPQDGELLADYCQPGVALLNVAVVMCMEGVLADVSGPVCESRKALALECLGHLGPKAGERAVTAVITALEDESDDVRTIAAWSLASMVPKERMTAEVSKRMGSASPDVIRTAAVVCWLRSALRGARPPSLFPRPPPGAKAPARSRSRSRSPPGFHTM